MTHTKSTGAGICSGAGALYKTDSKTYKVVLYGTNGEKACVSCKFLVAFAGALC